MIKVTPCCKSRQYRWAVGPNFETLIRCHCGKLHDFESLVMVVRGFNPLTHYCDNCHKSALEELKEVATAI